jgi:hypothetical protein
MAEIYGVEGSATYAVAYENLDFLISKFQDNTTNDISALDTRSAFLTVWNNSGGGGSFSYTQTAPLTVKSTQGVGGIGAGRTFSNVPLQEIFDAMFFPAVGTGFSIGASPAALELSGPATTTLTTRITSNTFPVLFTDISGGPGNQVKFSVKPKIPTGFGVSADSSYSGVNVEQNTSTQYTLFVNDGTQRSTSVTVTWFFPRWVGTIDLNTYPGFGSPNLDTSTLTQTQKNSIISTLRGPLQTWAPVWQGSAITSFKQYDNQQVSEVLELKPKNTVSGSHIVFIFQDGDYGGDGTPSAYKFGVNKTAAQAAFPEGLMVLLDKKVIVKNQYGAEVECTLWIKNYKLTGETAILIS